MCSNIKTKNSSGDETPERDTDMRHSLWWVHQRSILLPLLRLTPPMKRFTWDDLKILCRGQRMAKVANGKEISPKLSTPEYGALALQMTDRFAIAKTRT